MGKQRGSTAPDQARPPLAPPPSASLLLLSKESHPEFGERRNGGGGIGARPPMSEELRACVQPLSSLPQGRGPALEYEMRLWPGVALPEVHLVADAPATLHQTCLLTSKECLCPFRTGLLYATLHSKSRE